MMKVAVLGYGTVGSGVVEVLEANSKSIEKKAGKPIEVKYILDIRNFEEDPRKALITSDFNTILEDEEVEIVAEAMGGVEPAYTYVKAALQAGKSVVTSNKELVALHGPELLEIAKQKCINFLFEASVGGGIPIIKPLNNALTADEIVEISGILNGTTNFILTKMKNEGRSFDDVLKEAQDLGYAERNPAADVEGHDACRKIAILSSLAFGEHIDFQDVPTEGITKITKEDMDYAASMGYVIKILGSCKRENGEIFARVAPMMISNEHPLAMVNDVFNAVFIHGNMVGDVMFYGRGAGKLPTASAVVSDIVDAARHPETTITIQWSREKLALKNKDEVMSQYFVRLEGDRLFAANRVKELFGDVEEIPALADHEYTFVTPLEKEGQIEHKLTQLADAKVVSKIRIQK
ncbi:MAG: homoserine dehydrogenase [Cellulosilyticaceae bacterium]